MSMNNDDRRKALTRARLRAWYWAEQAEQNQGQYGNDSNTMREYKGMAEMWASVAQALKIGSADADS